MDAHIVYPYSLNSQWFAHIGYPYTLTNQSRGCYCVVVFAWPLRAGLMCPSRAEWVLYQPPGAPSPHSEALRGAGWEQTRNRQWESLSTAFIGPLTQAALI